MQLFVLAFTSESISRYFFAFLSMLLLQGLSPCAAPLPLIGINTTCAPRLSPQFCTPYKIALCLLFLHQSCNAHSEGLSHLIFRGGHSFNLGNSHQMNVLLMASWVSSPNRLYLMDHFGERLLSVPDTKV